MSDYAPSADATGELLLALSRGRLTSEEQARTRPLLDRAVDWQQLADLACLHGVVALVRHNLLLLDAASVVPAAPWELMQQAAAQIAFDGMLQLRETGRMVAALEAAGSRPILLKGQALAAMLYDDPVLRPAVDVDLLVRREEIPAARSALAAIGYRPVSQDWMAYQLERSYHLSLLADLVADRQILLELHWDLGGRGLFDLDLEAMRGHSQEFSVAGISQPLHRFSTEDSLLHLAMHMRKHRYVGLRWLCDAAELLRRFGDGLDWPYVLDTAHRAGLRTLLFMTLSLAGELLGAPMPEDALHRLRPSRLRRRLLHGMLTRQALLTPVEMEEAGWTRLAPAEILLLDRPTAMGHELRYRLAPPPEKLAGLEAGQSGAGQRLSLQARRLVRRTTILLRR